MADAAYIVVPADQGTKRYEVKRASFGIATGTNTTLVAAVTGKSIRLLSLSMVSAGTQTFDINDGTNYMYGTSDQEAVLAAASVFPLDFTKYGWFDTAVGAALIMTTTASVELAGCLTYCEV
jgi:hypothetical protein